MELTIDTAYRELQQILRDKVLLVVGTGASMALDRRFGMEALSDELMREIPKHINGKNEEKEQWDEVAEKLKKGNDLESALKETSYDFLIDKIVQVTGDFLVGLDKKYKLKILNNEIKIPIENFIEILVKGLPEYDPILDIITPNYDLLIEHCCDSLKIPFVTGFSGGLRKYENWEEAKNQMDYTKYIPKGKKRVKVERTKRHIRLYKVHGSLNWFIKSDRIVEDNTLAYRKYSEIKMERFIITPGDKKYKKAFLVNFGCFKQVSEIIPRSRVFIFLGYGFNDDHIHRQIREELIDKKKPGIIITKGLSAKAEKFLQQSDKLWAVYQDTNNSKSGGENVSFIYNNNYKKPLELKNSRIWEIQNFSREVLGE